jgi:hypothetical protein
MSITERSYGGKLFRPTPEVHLEPDGSFGVIATPWGARPSARKVIEILKDHVLASRDDLEATSPFQKLTVLSPLANSLRVAIMLANDTLYREDNKNEYQTGVEVVVFAHQLGELAYAQVGFPQLFLSRKNLPWITVSSQIDLATELSHPPTVLPPLPQNVLGLHTTTNLNIGSLKTQTGDRLIALSHSVVPHPLLGLPSGETSVDAISQSLARHYPELPFWLGLVEFD